MRLLNAGKKINLHTHTCYCDGKDAPEDLVREALARGFSVLGFSGHGFSRFDGDFCMNQEETERYRREVLRLKEAYQGRIELLLGVEMDYYGEKDDYPYDFVIGSVHSVEKDGAVLSVDNTAEIMEDNVTRYFGGDYRAYVERYYEIEADVLRKTGADIIGHFDLVTKFNEGNRYFDEEADWYRAAALGALRRLAAGAAEDAGDAGKKPVFEINTGAMARGYRTRPYPADFILEEIEALGCPVILSSDCHDRQQLDYGFEEVRSMVKTGNRGYNI